MSMLSAFPLGRYVPRDSFLHRVDPRTKLLFLVGFTAALFIAQSLPLVALFAFIAVGSVRLGDIPYAYVVRTGWPMSVFIALLAFAQLFVERDGAVVFAVGPLHVTTLGVAEAVRLTLRLGALLLVSTLITLTTSPIALAHGVSQLLRPLARLGVPVDAFGLMIMIALRFIPTLLDTLERLIKAQAARGAEFNSRSLKVRLEAASALVIPLFVFAFERAEAVAAAMEARGYAGDVPRTSRRRLRYGRRDVAVFGALVVLVILAVCDRVGGALGCGWL
ncbi:MAG: energy-coupling factor transporter transmembrane protein EcfT [Hydrogenibacillus sp.]|nr:energy-coupling factor transporter transmembrane protein EcfT [Hydrogenibacillus sp.]